MNVVGKVGSLISQGVYSVATPFHPFGGAVDVIVVEQQDGTYRSTPWYVRFGKFQGVLKGAEKIVTITVNGVQANFHMQLDNSGQAYFMREVVSGNSDDSSGKIIGESSPSLSKLSSGNYVNNGEDQPQQHTYDSKKDDSVENDVELFRFQDELASPASSGGSSAFGNYQYASLDEVENMVKESNDANEEMVLISVDGHVLTVPISSNEENIENIQLETPQFHLGPGEGTSGNFTASGEMWDHGLFGDMDTSTPNDEEVFEHQLQSPKGHEDSISAEDAETIVQAEADNKHPRVGLATGEMFQSCLDLASHDQDFDAQDVSLSKEVILETNRESSEKHLEPESPKKNSKSELPEKYSEPESSEKLSKSESPEKHAKLESPGKHTKPESSEKRTIIISSTETKVNKDLEFRSDELLGITATAAENLEHDSSGNSKCKDNGPECLDQEVVDISCSASIFSETQEPITCGERISSAKKYAQEVSGVDLSLAVDSGGDQSVSSPMSAFTEECHQSENDATLKNKFGLGFEISLCGNLLRPGMGHNLAGEAFESQRISEEIFMKSGPSIIKNTNLIVRYRNNYFKWDKAVHIIVGKAVFGPNFTVELSDPIEIEQEDAKKCRDDASVTLPASSGGWRLWPIPFRRSLSLRHTNDDSEDLFVDSESGFHTPDKEGSAIQSPRKQYVRTNIPTTEQVASLKLKEGQNMVTFSFSTRVLGRQQVDAHIYLWKWNAKIVISDVDGTITKSDVLGQFMPLVGKDWTQSGVARLFCAIKENGYQLLFLSARAIVQAYLTRSFLLNLKQDGKALPSGPVVISPDGLFPSLYREVIRRAPHEFKIACLEDIKALFPSDYNPFYAGFGNRDTDELSYRKIGIAKGKIFIINPKGEVAINNCVDVKSYTSLHTLVNDMFPPTSLLEQEDFNSWNYWKMPLTDIEP